MLLLLPLFFGGAGHAFSQTIWTGNESPVWDNAANWSAGIPDTDDDVTIPDVTTAPVIGNEVAAEARSVQVQAGASLTIAQGGSLTITNAFNYDSPFEFSAGFNNLGTVQNNGRLTLGSESGVGTYGVINQGVFTNRMYGQIRIDNTTDTGLYHASGTFTNEGALSIGGNASVGLHGIWNDAVFENKGFGDIRIDRYTQRAIMNNADEFIQATFRNAASIFIGAVNSAGEIGIQNLSTFHNNAGGKVEIARTGNIGIYNASGSFENTAAIVVGALANAGKTGIVNHGTFGNSGSIAIDRTTLAAMTHAAGTFTNGGAISIGASAGVGMYGMVNRSGFQNAGEILIGNFDDTGLYHADGTFTNTGGINITGIGNVSVHGLFSEAAFYNTTGGDIRLDGATLAGLRNFNSTFSNAAGITIGATASVGAYGIYNQSDFANTPDGAIHIDRAAAGVYAHTNTFTNEGNVTIGSLEAVSALLTQQGTGLFSNHTGGLLEGTGDVGANSFSHAGGTLSPGYSPGVITFQGDQDFSNSVIAAEASGTGAAGVDFDQIVVAGTATLGGMLSVSVDYTPTDGDEVTLLSAATIAGTFGSVTGLPAGWEVVYTPNTVSIRYDSESLPVHLAGFEVRAKAGGVQLHWRTTSESRNHGFYIERSTDGKGWADIGFVTGQGVTGAGQAYDFFDENPGGGISYYRLRQTDLDGVISHSDIRSVRLSGTDSNLIVWADASRKLHFRTEEVIEQVTVRDLSGRPAAISGAAHPDVSGLPPGVWLVQVQTQRGVVTRKVLLR